MRKALIAFIAACGLLLAAASDAHAWGAARGGFSYRGYGGGFYHTSGRVAYGPYGEHGATRSTGYSPYTGFYHTSSRETAGYGYGGTGYHYSGGAYRYGGGYHYGGYGYASGYGYGAAGYAGAYRRW
jgi:hypothetical protein